MLSINVGPNTFLPVWKWVSGSRRYPMSMVYVITAWAVINRRHYANLSRFRWLIDPPRRGHHATSYAFRFITVNNHSIQLKLHREVAELNGLDTSCVIAHHPDPNGLNCTDENLKSASVGQNRADALKHQGISKFKGVSLQRSTGRWSSRIYEHPKVVCLGYYPTEVEAALVYDRRAVQLHGPWARTNAMMYPELTQ